MCGCTSAIVLSRSAILEFYQCNAIDILLRAREQNRLRKELAWFRNPHVLLLNWLGDERLKAAQTNAFFLLYYIQPKYGEFMTAEVG